MCDLYIFVLMNANLNRVFKIVSKPERLILGLMSGTSLDGLDIALCSIKGSGATTKVTVLDFKTVPYSTEFKVSVKAIFSRRDADLQMVCIMNEHIAVLHSEMILKTLSEWGRSAEDVDAIASHGQTIFHAPASLHNFPDYPNATLQIGDGDHIAVKTGILTLCDFRQKHLAAGGEGAPLAVYGDYLIFSEKGEERIMLNIGGIANFTYLPGDNDASKVFSTDVGPGNTIMDQYVQKYYQGMYYDEGAAIASQGVINQQLLDALMKSSFLNAGFPKTTGPELFNLQYLEGAQVLSGTLLIKKEDIMATLCSFSAKVIVSAVESCLKKDYPSAIYLSGGGMHNPMLLKELKAGLTDVRFSTTAELGIDPDAKEAVLFAVLANETLMGESIDFGERKGVPSVCMGKICLPR